MDNPKKEELLKMTLEEIQKIVERQRRDIEDYENSQKQKLIEQYLKNEEEINKIKAEKNAIKNLDTNQVFYDYLNTSKTKRQDKKTLVVEELGPNNTWKEVPFNDYRPFYASDGYYYCYDINDKSLWVSPNGKDWTKSDNKTKKEEDAEKLDKDNYIYSKDNVHRTNKDTHIIEYLNNNTNTWEKTYHNLEKPFKDKDGKTKKYFGDVLKTYYNHRYRTDEEIAKLNRQDSEEPITQEATQGQEPVSPTRTEAATPVVESSVTQSSVVSNTPQMQATQQIQTTVPFNYNDYDYSRGNHLTKYQKIEKAAENYVEGQKATSSFKRIMKKIGTGFGVALGAGIALNSFGLAVPIGAVGMLLKSVDKEKELDERDAKIKGDIYEKEEKLKITGYGPARNKLQNELNDARIEENLIEATRMFRFKEFLRTSVKWAGIVGTIGTALVSFPVGLGAAAVAGIGVEWSKSDSKTKEKEDAYLEKVRQEELAKLRYAQQQYLAYQAARNNQAVQQQTNNNPIIVPNNVLIGNQQMQNSQGGRTL